MKKEELLGPITIKRMLTVDKKALFSIFRILNSKPGVVLYSLTYENINGEYWAKIVNQEELDEHLANKK